MRARGFTLVELAIVVVVIGLLMAGILKGTGLIQSSKVSSAIELMQDLSGAVNAFKQQYHLLPGDMSITTEIPAVRAECKSGGTNAGDNNGMISAAESTCVPEVLFKAGLVKTDQANGWAVFKTAYGPVTVIAASLSGTAVSLGHNPYPPSVTHVAEFHSLPCDVVQDIDRKIDNDDLTSGRAIAAGGACAPDSTVTVYDIAL